MVSGYGLIMGMQEYMPIPWRVARALDNPMRLEMLRVVFHAKGNLAVGDICAAIGEKESVTSQYLRILNSQGFVAAVRRGKNVFYERRRDGAGAFMRFVDVLESVSSEANWKDRVLCVLPAFSNARKIAIHSTLAKEGALPVEALAARTTMPVKTCYRIVRELEELGFVEWNDSAAMVSAASPDDVFGRAYLEYANGISSMP